ncbi:Predicted PurR-regulated permease PerM [Cyclobacterium xiamenense]|uniref:Predicted PurR-regulated permease PerM n=1 Tax=Cyclobacterium xiamenense TaxID=1297121 RepID=A0A1H7AAB4_9BACT|nr:AI-2E family transporter [Cyclobacterium xiamenense]SEJ57965.1 Predicted PurR-regulated permease PerM [Cyclobacterium xiamenense]
MQLSFQHLFFTLAFTFLLVAALVLAKTILIPLGLALLLSFILHPVHKKLREKKFGNIGAALTVLVLFFLILIGILAFFSAEILSLSDQLTDFGDKLMNIFTDTVVFLNENFSFLGNLEKDALLEDGKTWLKDAGAGLLGRTFSSTASIFTGLFTMIIYTFLFLIYKQGLVNAFVKFGPDDKKSQYLTMLKNIQQVGQKYLSGMLTLILILGLANSAGLWIIGLDNPFLFGFLAATLSIIPYIGTTIGASIPVLYAFMSKDELWVPLAVAAMFWLIQVIESNFLSPKVVGNSVNVNAFAAILSLIIGASVWGVAGMVLFLPFAAMLKAICESYVPLQPLAMLIGQDAFNDKPKKT